MDAFYKGNVVLDSRTIFLYEEIEAMYTGAFLLGKDYSWSYLEQNYYKKDTRNL